MKVFAAISVAVGALSLATLVPQQATKAESSSRLAMGRPPEIHRRLLRTRMQSTPAPCSTDYVSGGGAGGSYFVGIPSQSEIAGGDDSGVVDGFGNEACASESTVAGGAENAITQDLSFIGAGYSNSVAAGSSFNGAGQYNQLSGDFAFDGAGVNNIISADYSFIGAGEQNSVSGTHSIIGSGKSNTASSDYALVGNGYSNAVAGDYSVIVGGYENVANGSYGSIGVGLGNSAGGKYSAVPGGFRSLANGELSFAAGYQARALHSGSFVWSDYVPQGASLSDTAPDQFIVRASGGTTFYSNESQTSGVTLAPGSGTWSSVMDSSSAMNFRSIDDDAVLNRVIAMPIGTWSYRAQSNVRHVGPMASDFRAAFGMGEDDHHISSIDEDGIALAAIKALAQRNNILEQRIENLEKRLTATGRRP